LSRKLKILGRLLFVALVAAAALGAWFYSDFQRFADSPLAPLPESATLDVALGTPLPGIVRDLQAHGIGQAPVLYWRLLARQMGVAGKLHAGEFALPPGITPRGLLAKMAAGEVIQHKFTIVEGWTFAQLRDALAHDAVLAQTLPALSDADVMKELGAGGAPPEGWFLPQTYQFVKGMSDLDVLRRAHKAMKQTLDKLWDSRAADLPR